METSPVEKRLWLPGLMIVVGLIVQFAASLFIHPLAFVAFLLMACPLVASGVLLYLYTLIRAD
jgi:hypothetical protein